MLVATLETLALLAFAATVIHALGVWRAAMDKVAHQSPAGTWSKTFPTSSRTSTWCARSWTWSCAESSRNRPPRPFAGSVSTETSRRSGVAGA